MEQLGTVIVENRKFDNFGDVCKSHLQFLPKGTKLFVFTDVSLVDEYTKQLKGVGINNVEFFEYPTTLPIPNQFYGINGFGEMLETNTHLKPILNYCMLMTSNWFWHTFNSYYRVLTFQMDTALLRNGIEDFYKWDYVGAPCYSYVEDNTIQNGGLSLRNPRIMEYISRYHGWNTDLGELIQLGQGSTASFFAEDIFFTYRMIKHKIGNIAPMEQAKLFSVESKFVWGSLGYHSPEKYLKEEDLERLKGQYNKKDLDIKK